MVNDVREVSDPAALNQSLSLIFFGLDSIKISLPFTETSLMLRSNDKVSESSGWS